MMQRLLLTEKFNRQTCIFKVLLLAVLFLAPPVSAVEENSPFQCNYDGNQQEMNACAVRDYKTADSILNKKYTILMSSLPTAKQKQLRQQQRSWLKNRDPQCKTEVKASEGGSIWSLEFFACLKLATERRTHEFEHWQTR